LRRPRTLPVLLRRAFPTVGMGRITWCHRVLCFVIGALISASLLMVLRRLSGLSSQKRIGSRLIRVGTAVLLLGMIIWCIFQKYLFITSVFPVLSVWLGAAVFVFSSVLLLSAKAWLKASERFEEGAAVIFVIFLTKECCFRLV